MSGNHDTQSAVVEGSARTKVTLDTNVLNDTKVEQLQAMARGLPIDFQQLTVTEREHEAWQGANFTAPFPSIPETGIFGEAQFGRAVFAAAGAGPLLEAILKIIASGSAPNQNQLRDALILLSHTRVGNTILVSNDAKAYSGKDGTRRTKREALCKTRVMTLTEFSAYCDSLR